MDGSAAVSRPVASGGHHPAGGCDRQVGLWLAHRHGFHPRRQVEPFGIGQRVGQVQQLAGLAGQLVSQVPGRLHIVTNCLGIPFLQRPDRLGDAPLRSKEQGGPTARFNQRNHAALRQVAESAVQVLDHQFAERLHPSPGCQPPGGHRRRPVQDNDQVDRLVDRVDLRPGQGQGQYQRGEQFQDQRSGDRQPLPASARGVRHLGHAP